jgi:hypothetical protein
MFFSSIFRDCCNCDHCCGSSYVSSCAECPCAAAALLPKALPFANKLMSENKLSERRIWCGGKRGGLNETKKSSRTPDRLQEKFSHHNIFVEFLQKKYSIRTQLDETNRLICVSSIFGSGNRFLGFRVTSLWDLGYWYMSIWFFESFGIRWACPLAFRGSACWPVEKKTKREDRKNVQYELINSIHSTSQNTQQNARNWTLLEGHTLLPNICLIYYQVYSTFIIPFTTQLALRIAAYLDIMKILYKSRIRIKRKSLNPLKVRWEKKCVSITVLENVFLLKNVFSL